MFLTAYGENYTKALKMRFTSPTSLFNIYFSRKPILLDDLVKKVNEIITNTDNNNGIPNT